MSRAINLNTLSHVIESHNATHSSDVASWRHGGTALDMEDARTSYTSYTATDTSDERSRIEAALEGTHDWHLRVNRVARGSLRATYEVVFARGVPVRAQPHLDSAVIRLVRARTRVVGVSLTGDGWLELLGVDADGNNIEGSAGFMLTTHVEHGVLLKHVDGVDLPSTTMRLASSECTSTCNHDLMPHAQDTNTYRVVYAPALPVRDAARTDANVVSYKMTNAVVRACGRRGDWIELPSSSDDKFYGVTDVGTAAADDDDDDDDSDTNAAAATKRLWMLSFHPDFGRLMCRVNADGSDTIDTR
jgi:hypothetical protein